MARNNFRDKASETRVLERRAKVMELTLKCWSQHRIAKEVGVSQPQVMRDQRECIEEWRERYLQDVDAIKGKEVARIELLLSHLWEEFEVSRWRTIPAKLDKEGKPVKGPAGKDRKVRVVADMAVGQQIRDAILMLWKIYGIGQDSTTNNTNNTVNVFSVDKLTETLKQVALEENNSRLAEVERLQKEQERLVEITVTDEMSPLEKLEARRAKERYEAEQAQQANGRHQQGDEGEEVGS
jgi:predicted XRE-type DNA-binding protein